MHGLTLPEALLVGVAFIMTVGGALVTICRRADDTDQQFLNDDPYGDTCWSGWDVEQPSPIRRRSPIGTTNLKLRDPLHNGDLDRG